MNPLVDGLVVADSHWQVMAGHVQNCLPEEACGLAGGQFRGQLALIDIVLPVPNQLHSRVRFRMDPAEQLKALLALDERGLDLVAIFHSHPLGPETPSPTDLEEFAYPGVLSLIFFPLAAGRGWQARAYHLTSKRFDEVPVTRPAG